MSYQKKIFDCIQFYIILYFTSYLSFDNTHLIITCKVIAGCCQVLFQITEYKTFVGTFIYKELNYTDKKFGNSISINMFQ